MLWSMASLELTTVLNQYILIKFVLINCEDRQCIRHYCVHFHFIRQQVLDQAPNPIKEMSDTTVPATDKNIKKDICSNVI